MPMTSTVKIRWKATKMTAGPGASAERSWAGRYQHSTDPCGVSIQTVIDVRVRSSHVPAIQPQYFGLPGGAEGARAPAAELACAVDLAVAHMVASPLWGDMEAEAAKILAEGHAARGDGAQARAWFAKTLHSDPLDRCSWSSLFHWSSSEGKFGCLVPLAAQDESGTILTLVKAGRTRNESTQRRMLAKCLHQYPERPELWAMRPGLA